MLKSPLRLPKEITPKPFHPGMSASCDADGESGVLFRVRMCEVRLPMGSCGGSSYTSSHTTADHARCCSGYRCLPDKWELTEDGAVLGASLIGRGNARSAWHEHRNFKYEIRDAIALQ